MARTPVGAVLARPGQDHGDGPSAEGPRQRLEQQVGRRADEVDPLGLGQRQDAVAVDQQVASGGATKTAPGRRRSPGGPAARRAGCAGARISASRLGRCGSRCWTSTTAAGEVGGEAGEQALEGGKPADRGHQRDDVEPGRLRGGLIHSARSFRSRRHRPARRLRDRPDPAPRWWRASRSGLPGGSPPVAARPATARWKRLADATVPRWRSRSAIRLQRAARSSRARRAVQSAVSSPSDCWASRLLAVQAWPTRQRNRISSPSWSSQSDPPQSGQPESRGLAGMPIRTGSHPGRTSRSRIPSQARRAWLPPPSPGRGQGPDGSALRRSPSRGRQ